MDRRTRERLVERATIFKAIAHPLRLRFVEELARGERCVHDLARLTASRFSSCSHHLSILRTSAVLTSRRDGKHVYYGLYKADFLQALRSVERILEGRTRKLKTLCRTIKQTPSGEKRQPLRIPGGR